MVTACAFGGTGLKDSVHLDVTRAWVAVPGHTGLVRWCDSCVKTFASLYTHCAFLAETPEGKRCLCGGVVVLVLVLVGSSGGGGRGGGRGGKGGCGH